jgi:hypothetical protein
MSDQQRCRMGHLFLRGAYAHELLGQVHIFRPGIRLSAFDQCPQCGDDCHCSESRVGSCVSSWSVSFRIADMPDSILPLAMTGEDAKCQ